MELSIDTSSITYVQQKLSCSTKKITSVNSILRSLKMPNDFEGKELIKKLVKVTTDLPVQIMNIENELNILMEGLAEIENSNMRISKQFII